MIVYRHNKGYQNVEWTMIFLFLKDGSRCGNEQHRDVRLRRSIAFDAK